MHDAKAQDVQAPLTPVKRKRPRLVEPATTPRFRWTFDLGHWIGKRIDVELVDGTAVRSARLDSVTWHIVRFQGTRCGLPRALVLLDSAVGSVELSRIASVALSADQLGPGAK